MACSTSSIQNLVLFVFLCIFTSAFSSFNGGKNGLVCNARERDALLKFKNALNAFDDVLHSWVGEDCCSWDGVTCNNKTAHVIKLNVSGAISDRPVFTGEIDPSLLELNHLTYLNLSYNYFGSKPIPMFFGLFKKLRYLDLSLSYFGGTIPQELGNLSSLRYLDLSYGFYLSVDNLHWLSHLSSLQHLDLSYVNISRATNWIQEVNMLPSLSVLDLSSCDLLDVPSLPYLNFTSLTSLYLGGNFDLAVNNLHWLSQFSSLQHLDLSYVNLSRAANWIQEVNMLPSLSVLDLSSCDISNVPTLPYLNFKSLTSLDLSGNYNLRVDNLLWLSHLSSLQHLDLSNVNISRAANWIQEVNMLPFLSKLDLSFCEISNIPALPYLNFTSLTSLDLSGNFDLGVDNLHWLSHLSSLQQLDMSHVSLSKALNWLQEVNMLPSLSVLRLSDCQLSDSSTLPTYLNFKSLTSLDLSYNYFSSKFLHWLVNLHDLVYLDLSSNYIKGPIPNALGSLCNLESLDLWNNTMDGDLNGFLQVLSGCEMRDGRMSSIRYLDLSSNNFSGTLLPESLGELPNLEQLNMANNALEGVLSEVHFANLTGLHYLDISSNSFVLSVGDDWIPPFQLKDLFLGSCQLGPRFPMWLRHTKGYLNLNLSNTQISDIVPHWFWNVSSNAYYIDLSHNQIRGQIPNSPNFSVATLDLSSNLFSGPLIHINVMLYLALSENNLSGSIPSSICERQSLYVLDLSNNGFTGQIPSCLEQLWHLNVLDLSNNQLSGEIPIGLFSYSGLRWLQLSYNKFSGGLPSSFGIQDNFIVIDLSQNGLSGLLPEWNSKNLSGLRILNLRSNMFHGNIPAQLSQLPSLQILDLSHNRLSGNIPSSFGNFNGMKREANQRHSMFDGSYQGKSYADKEKLVMKGNELEYTKTLRFVASIDLSSNNLSGEIPEEITSLYELQSLNLSSNQLAGRIPKSFAKLRQLESLDLSLNHLFGAIPANMEALTFLGSLNFSYNNLSGPIPQGNHLQTFTDPSIYMGNRDLCGPPLAKACQVEVPQTPGTLGGGGDEEDGVEKLWFYIGMAPGFVIGFWCIFGPLLFSKSWRISYYKFLDNLMNRLRRSL